MATNAAYKGVEIERASYRKADMPGWWFPRVMIRNPNNGVEKPVSLMPQKGTEQDANAAALKVALHRIKTGEHDLGELPSSRPDRPFQALPTP